MAWQGPLAPKYYPSHFGASAKILKSDWLTGTEHKKKEEESEDGKDEQQEKKDIEGL